MNSDKIARCVTQLLSVASPRDARWLNRLLRNPAAYDAYSALENELFVGKDYSGGPVLITSATRQEGRTTIALLLAVMTSALESARKVLLVDADTDNGRLSAIFSPHEGRPGLRELSDGEAGVADCVYQSAVPNLWLTPVARDSGGAVRLAPQILKSFIEETGKTFDLVVVDSPAGGTNKAVLSMASIIRNTLVVIKYGGPTREQVASLLEDLNRVDARVLGCVLNQREFVVPRLLYGSR